MKIRSLVCVLLLTVPVSAATQDFGVRSYGLRGGIAANPDQFAIGAHLDAGRLNRRIRFQPSVELGLGNGVLLGSANFDLHYLFGLIGRSYRPYAGGGIGLNVIDVRNGFGQGSGFDLEPVLNLVGGMEWGAHRKGTRALNRYLVEARVGMGDTPELKLVFGLNF
jgi:hypothetical protein